MKPGSQVGWTEGELAAKLQLPGWDSTGSWLTKIEARQVYVRNFELLHFHEVFGRARDEMFPNLPLQSAALPSDVMNEEATGPPQAGPVT